MSGKKVGRIIKRKERKQMSEVGGKEARQIGLKWKIVLRDRMVSSVCTLAATDYGKMARD